MKKTIKLFKTLFITALIINSYAGLTFAAEDHQHEEHKHGDHQHEDNQLKDKTDQLFKSYFQIKENLANDSILGLAGEARKIIKLVIEINKENDEHSKDKQQKEYQLITDIGGYASQMPHRDIDDVRKHFADMSIAIINYMEISGYQDYKKDKIFTYYCPMYKAYWVQEKEGMSNPFFGKKMSQCGSLVKSADMQKILMNLNLTNK